MSRQHSAELVDLVGEDGRRVHRWQTPADAERMVREHEERTGERLVAVRSSSRDIDNALAVTGEKRG